MMTTIRFTLLAGLALAAWHGPSPARAQVYSDRQHYSEWHHSTQDNFYYRHWNYKPYPTYDGYVTHNVCYFTQHPNYFYYYNPESQRFWGRTPVNRGGKELYSMLDQKDRKKDLKDIPESAFPEPSAPPTAPGAKDDLKMAMPPMDLPRIKK